MNYGPFIFLAGFFALATSWFGYVLTPQMQVGQLQQTNTVPLGATYPVTRPGLARQGLEVYRANGCASCHSQQVGQSGTVCDLVLNEPGTNQDALLKALLQVKPATAKLSSKASLERLPMRRSRLLPGLEPRRQFGLFPLGRTWHEGGASAGLWPKISCSITR